ncbi:MAG: trypsin-like peptidase domain-containing protein, partial [Planctomycetota bacterium]
MKSEPTTTGVRGAGALPGAAWGPSLALGFLGVASGLGRATAPQLAGPPAPSDDRARAIEVSRSFQAASQEASASVVQVRASRRRGRTYRVSREGSGVILSRDGVVVTNQHVVEKCDRFEVVFTDGSIAPATLVGADEGIDLAVLRLPLDEDHGVGPYRAMPLREELPSVGELVLAIGNPLSLGHTVTLGVVNGRGRARLDIADYENYIQTDAAINPGNSGGPLIDVEGRAVGINVAVGLASNGDEGLAFAIPSTMVQKVVEEILEHGVLRRAYLGIETYWEQRFYDPTQSDRAAGYEGLSRVKVRRVYPDTPAAEAGL